MANNVFNDKKGRYEVKNVTIETVDQAMFDYLDKRLAPTVDVERGRKRVPIIYASGERWKLIRKNKFRDKNGTLVLPIISVRRIHIDPTEGFGGMTGEVPEIVVSSIIHPKTTTFQNAIKQRKVNGFPEVRKNKVVREYLTLPYPDFSIIYYEINIWTQYQTQMNQILEKGFFKFDYRKTFVMPVEYDGRDPKGNSYYFVGFLDGNVVSQSNTDDFTDQERIIKYSYQIKTPVYLMLDPDGETLSYGKKDGKKVVYKYQNALDIKLKEQIFTKEQFEELFC